SAERERSAGACRGRYDLGAVLADGVAGGAAAAAAAGFEAAVPPVPTVEAVSLGSDGFIGATPHGRDPLKTRAWIDFQN
ncbi:hypothetical protein, partial [Stenotrophomonas maltophilia]|uniref:hypothetical protein n=1 Tax=Stenotrophomonas maltophilia TaxID=40324 RepID=UPI0013DC0352